MQLLQVLVALNKLHEDVTYMNFSSIQTSLHDIVVLQQILWSSNVIALFVFK